MATKDNLVIAALHGTAWRRVAERGRIDDAIAELEALAGGRHDLLAEAAGVDAGAWYARPSVDARPLLIAGLLVSVSGLIDCGELKRWTRIGYDRAVAPTHGTSTYGTPSHQLGDRR